MNKISYKENLIDLITNSKLTINEKSLWELFAKFSTSDEDEAVFEAASESYGNLYLLTKYLRDKIWHMKETNKTAWKRLLKDEEKYAEILDDLHD
ncbi:hypothetical protein DRH27_05430 [Candidatus Falkowbacteria bacterium]|nr:MAG: hypothetical protein DRH27_05430 [Candidatus Falkowbacteria bacterium]